MIDQDNGQALGENIRYYRKLLGLSQHALAHRSGVSRQAIAELERGSRTSSVRTLCMLGRALQVPAWMMLHPTGGRRNAA